jgi:RimJ/RimL family protein N-acetyltransferase
MSEIKPASYSAIVRLITEEDIPSFHEALGLVSLEKRYLAFTEPPPFESTRDFVLENIKGNLPQYVAVEGDRVLGWCDITPKSSRKVFMHCGVLGMGLRPESRGIGLGTELMQKTIAHARRMGLTRIELQVFTSNTRAIRLYEKLGFVLEGTNVRYARFEDRYEDSHTMALIFDH